MDTCCSCCCHVMSRNRHVAATGQCRKYVVLAAAANHDCMSPPLPCLSSPPAGRATLALAPELQPSHLASVAWAFAAVRQQEPRHRGAYDTPVFGALAASARKQILTFPTSELVNMIMAFSSETWAMGLTCAWCCAAVL